MHPISAAELSSPENQARIKAYDDQIDERFGADHWVVDPGEEENLIDDFEDDRPFEELTTSVELTPKRHNTKDSLEHNRIYT